MRHVRDRAFETPPGPGPGGDRVALAVERARAARLAFLARLPVGVGPLGVSWPHLRCDPALAAAREAWRAADRDAVSARDDAAALAADAPPGEEDST